MKFKYLVCVSLIFLLMFVNYVNVFAIPISTVYKQGIYAITDTDVVNVNIRLIKGSETIVMITEENQNMVLYTKLNLNEETKLKEVKKGYTLVVLGGGEIAFTYERVK